MRYPGGCYAPFYRWKIGLLPADQRPPIETPPGYCAAVPGGVNAYTDGFMENGQCPPSHPLPSPSSPPRCQTCGVVCVRAYM